MNMNEFTTELKDLCYKIKGLARTYYRNAYIYEGILISDMQKYCLDLKNLAVDFLFNNPNHLSKEGFRYICEMTVPNTVEECVKFKDTIQLMILYKVKYNECFIGSENFKLF